MFNFRFVAEFALYVLLVDPFCPGAELGFVGKIATLNVNERFSFDFGRTCCFHLQSRCMRGQVPVLHSQILSLPPQAHQNPNPIPFILRLS